MDDAQDHFIELLAQLIARANRMLADGRSVPPLGLLLMRDGSVEVSVAADAGEDQLPDLLDGLQASLSGKAMHEDTIASCIAYADEGGERIIALLENREHWCATALLPVGGDPPSVDGEAITIEDGELHIFPASH
jgi:hypothetical protein